MSVALKVSAHNTTQLNCQIHINHRTAYSSQHSSVCHLEISDRFVNKTAIKRKKCCMHRHPRRRTFFFIWTQNDVRRRGLRDRPNGNIYFNVLWRKNDFWCCGCLVSSIDDGMKEGPHSSFSFGFASIEFACLSRETHEHAETCARPIFSFLLSLYFFLSGLLTTRTRLRLVFLYYKLEIHLPNIFHGDFEFVSFWPRWCFSSSFRRALIYMHSNHIHSAETNSETEKSTKSNEKTKSNIFHSGMRRWPQWSFSLVQEVESEVERERIASCYHQKDFSKYWNQIEKNRNWNHRMVMRTS